MRSASLCVGLLGMCLATCLIGGMARAPSAFACRTSENEEEHCYSIAVLEDEGEPVASEMGGYIFLGCIGIEDPPYNFNTDEM
jgi:hypothetical protein